MRMKTSSLSRENFPPLRVFFAPIKSRKLSQKLIKIVEIDFPIFLFLNYLFVFTYPLSAQKIHRARYVYAHVCAFKY